MKCDAEGCKNPVTTDNRYLPMIFDEGVERCFCSEACKAAHLMRKWKRQDKEGS